MKPLKIEPYNDKWIHSSNGCVSTSSTIINQPSNEIDLITFQPYSFPPPVNTDGNHNNIMTDVSPTVHLPSTASVEQAVMTDDIPSDETNIDQTPKSTEIPLIKNHDIHSALASSDDKLLFIQYTPYGTLI